MGITEYISIGVFALSVISSIVSIVISKFKNKSKLEDYKSETERNEKIISLVSEIIPQAVVFAEQNGGNNGANKKLLALSRILLDCARAKIDYEENADNIDTTIERLIEFSKEVNAIKVNKVV